MGLAAAATEPVVAGRLHVAGDLVNFNYGQSYLGRDDGDPALPAGAAAAAWL